MESIIQIDSNLRIPKYKQIINSIYVAIENGKLQKGDKIDSINNVCEMFSLSRDTVMVAYNELKAKGILMSTPGKGYYIQSVNITYKEKIFLLFDELNAFKEDLYNSFLKSLSSKAKVDIYFHHFNRNVFNSVIKDHIGNYSKYVIMPASFQNFYPLFHDLLQDKVYILDQIKPELKDNYPGVYQNFDKDMYDALCSGKKLLDKYSRLILVFPGGKEPKGQQTGFIRFCKEFGCDHEIISTPYKRKIVKGEVFIVPNDRHLVYLVKKANEMQLTLGKDIGIISYNDTPLKEVVEGGITTISTNFKKMGETLAELLENKQKGLIENPASLIIRNSL